MMSYSASIGFDGKEPKHLLACVGAIKAIINDIGRGFEYVAYQKRGIDVFATYEPDITFAREVLKRVGYNVKM